MELPLSAAMCRFQHIWREKTSTLHFIQQLRWSLKLMESMLAALTRTVNASCLIHILILTILQLRLKHITALSRTMRETLPLLHIVAAARSSRELIFQLSVIMYSLLFMTISYLWISLTASILMKTTANFCSVNWARRLTSLILTPMKALIRLLSM